jgi:hypothetical protein
MSENPYDIAFNIATKLGRTLGPSYLTIKKGGKLPGTYIMTAGSKPSDNKLIDVAYLSGSLDGLITVSLFTEDEKHIENIENAIKTVGLKYQKLTSNYICVCPRSEDDLSQREIDKLSKLKEHLELK